MTARSSRSSSPARRRRRASREQRWVRAGDPPSPAPPDVAATAPKYRCQRGPGVVRQIELGEVCRGCWSGESRAPSREVNLMVIRLWSVALAALVVLVAGAGSSRAGGSPFVAVDLGTLGGTSSSAVAISPDGQVVGIAGPASGAGPHAFAWTQAGGMVDLGTLGGGSSYANAIGPTGQVVGRSTTAGDAQTHAFSWTQAGGMIDLGTLGGAPQRSEGRELERRGRGVQLGARPCVACVPLDAGRRDDRSGHSGRQLQLRERDQPERPNRRLQQDVRRKPRVLLDAGRRDDRSRHARR